MTAFTSTKPYMVRAIHEWCVDNGLTPHLLVAVNAKCRVPVAYVKGGEIVLNLNYAATKDLQIDNEAVMFSARFGGVSQNLYVPMGAVKGLFARENGQGMFFEVGDDVDEGERADQRASQTQSDASPKSSIKKQTKLTIVK